MHHFPVRNKIIKTIVVLTIDVLTSSWFLYWSSCCWAASSVWRSLCILTRFSCRASTSGFWKDPGWKEQREIGRWDRESGKVIKVKNENGIVQVEKRNSESESVAMIYPVKEKKNRKNESEKVNERKWKWESECEKVKVKNWMWKLKAQLLKVITIE